jgi:hypothetical protein
MNIVTAIDFIEPGCKIINFTNSNSNLRRSNRLNSKTCIVEVREIVKKCPDYCDALVDSCLVGALQKMRFNLIDFDNAQSINSWSFYENNQVVKNCINLQYQFDRLTFVKPRQTHPSSGVVGRFTAIVFLFLFVFATYVGFSLYVNYSIYGMVFIQKLMWDDIHSKLMELYANILNRIV